MAAWSNVRLIFLREMRDQLRDRRTMFMIVLFPLLLYPALGLGIVQMTLSFRQERRTVGVLGVENLPTTPPLLSPSAQAFHADLFDNPRDAERYQVSSIVPWTPRDVLTGKIDALLIIPPGTKELLAGDQQIHLRLLRNSTFDSSESAAREVRAVVETWADRIVQFRLKQLGKSDGFRSPVVFDSTDTDLAPAEERIGAAWSKVFPFLLVVMALTGAFYPAVDLCAGEKERGTMETLLITPASRVEIVLGKFLTVSLLSVISTVVNLVSMGLTFVQTSSLAPEGSSAAEKLAAPSALAIFWMFLLMLPLSAFFSALCMALSIYARSVKEGTYYLMPMFLLVMPLVGLTLAPGVDLSPFTSLLPVANVALLLRALMTHQYHKALVYFLPVLTPTILYGYLALRYAVDQFRREDVLFREAEPLDIRLWVRRLMTNKPATPTSGEAWFCFVLMLLLMWYTRAAMPLNRWSLVISQLLLIAFPAVGLSLLLTRQPRQTLGLERFHAGWLPLAAALALCLHPVVITLGHRIQELAPVSDSIEQALQSILGGASTWTLIVLLALIPAVCEELAFRGIILSGLLRGHPPGRAIVISAILFGVFHMIPQQMVNASLLGIVLGLLLTRSGSIVPGMVFHFMNNALVVLHGVAVDRWDWDRSYNDGWVAAGALASALVLGMLASQRSLAGPKETRDSIPSQWSLSAPSA